MDIITCLRKEHDRVMGLMNQFETIHEAGKHQLVMQLLQELSVHEAAEEAAVWPTLRTATDAKLIDEAVREETELKQVLKHLQAKLDTPDMDGLVQKARQLLLGHLKTEQERIFPMVTAQLDEKQLKDLEVAYRDAKNAQLDRMAKLNVTMAPEAPVEQKPRRS